MDVEVFIEVCRESAILPSYSKPGDAGMDVYAAEEILIKPGETAIVPTGLKLAIPEGYEVQVRPRSGISLKTPLRLANSPGTIDCGYRGELGIIISNVSFLDNCNLSEVLTVDIAGNVPGIYKIRRGDRIAQLVLQQIPRMKLIKVDSVSCIGQDREGGFGSTGLR